MNRPECSELIKKWLAWSGLLRGAFFVDAQGHDRRLVKRLAVAPPALPLRGFRSRGFDQTQALGANARRKSVLAAELVR